MIRVMTGTGIGLISLKTSISCVPHCPQLFSGHPIDSRPPGRSSPPQNPQDNGCLLCTDVIVSCTAITLCNSVTRPGMAETRGVSGIRPRLVNCFQRRAPTTNRYSRLLLTFLLLGFPTATRVLCWIFTGLAAWQFSEIERFSEADGGVSTSPTRLIIRNIISFNLFPPVIAIAN